MKLQYTPQTARILKTIKPAEPQIDFDNIDKIETKFREFSLDSKKQFYLDELPPNSNKISNNDSKRTKKDDMKCLIRENYSKHTEETNLGLVNPVVAHFGNVLISSVFQALTVMTMHDTFNLKEEDYDTNFYSIRLLKSFGIDISQLKGIKTKEARIKFIKNSMNNSIEKMLKNWREKIEQREKNYQETQKEAKKTNENGGFGWLKLKTKHEALKTKLKQIVIQKLNDYQNQIKIIHTLNKKNQLHSPVKAINISQINMTIRKEYSSPKQRRSSSFSKINTNSHLKTNNSDKNLFMRDNLNSFLKTSSKNNEAANQRNRSIVFTSEIIEDSLKKEMSLSKGGRRKTKSVFDKKSEPYAKENKEDLNRFLSENVNDLVEISQKFFNSSLHWDEEMEKTFQQTKKKCKAIFYDELKARSWDCIGISNVIQTLFKDDGQTMKREEMMKRYSEGGWLTAEEIKFLADTSELLNACVDKKSIERSVETIDPENLHYMELNLAEQIIRREQEIKDEIKKRRQEFFQHKLQNTISSLKTRETISSDLRTLLSRRAEGEKFKRIAGKVSDLIEKSSQKAENELETSIVSELMTMNIDGRFRKNLSIADLLRKKEREEQGKKDERRKKDERGVRSSKKQFLRLMNGVNDPLIIKHKFHPTSKLHKVERDEREVRGVRGEEYRKMLEDQEEEFRLTIKCPKTIRKQEHFKRFLSGGPVRSRTIGLDAVDESGAPARLATKKEMDAIIRIQSRLRGMMARRRFKLMLDDHRNKKFVSAQERIFKKHYMMSHQRGDNSPISPHFKKYLQKTEDKLHRKNSHSMTLIGASESNIFINSSIMKNDSVRQDRILRKIPKTLLLKHRKLLEAAIENNFYMVGNSGFIFYKHDVDVRDKNGNCALYYTAKNKSVEFCKFLIKHEADVNLKCQEGNTPVHMAFFTNCLSIIMLFIENEANLNILNDNGQTALAFANEKTLKLLDLEKGVVSVNNLKEHLDFDNNKLFYRAKNEKLKFNNKAEFDFKPIADYTVNVRINNTESEKELLSYKGTRENAK